jgi:glyoxylase-like metal-dependent hydrolase (beta-lactamase superfamily II)
MCTAAIATCSSTLASAISACATMWRWSASAPSFVASPTHFDHIGCHHELGERCVRFADAAILADPRNEWTLADRYATDEMFDRFPEGWSAERYRIWLAPAQRPLADRDVVVLGDLSFQV